MHLDENQLKFLKSLSEEGNIPRNSVSDAQLDMILFLEIQGLIDAKRKVIHTTINRETHTYTNTYGDIISVSLSEKGKAYLEEIRLEEEISRREQLWKADFKKSIEEIANSAKDQADMALRNSRKAAVKGWIAIIISMLALFVEFIAYHEEIISFLSSIF